MLQDHKFTFQVTPNLKSPTTKLPPSSLDKEVQKLVPEGTPFTFEVGKSNYPLVCLDRYIANALVATVIEAYNEHYKLELSANDFWLVIAQGISKHINVDPEKYRSIFVSHQGKKTLEVAVDAIGIVPHSGRNEDKWPVAIKWMNEKIQSDIKAYFVTLLTAPFSVTGNVEQTAFHCTLMDSLKNYYEFRFTLKCGLPEVTLHGSCDDFAKMIERVNQLEILLPDLKWWFDMIRPNLAKLMETAEGKPDLEWWSQICHSKGGGSGITAIAGWLADFIPYSDDGKGGIQKAKRNHNTVKGRVFGIDFQDFTEAVTDTPFILDDNGKEYKMKLMSGFVGVSQNPDTLALRPAIGWITVYDDRTT